MLCRITRASGGLRTVGILSSSSYYTAASCRAEVYRTTGPYARRKCVVQVAYRYLASRGGQPTALARLAICGAKIERHTERSIQGQRQHRERLANGKRCWPYLDLVGVFTTYRPIRRGIQQLLWQQKRFSRV